jgi:hypothetical protein
MFNLSSISEPEAKTHLGSRGRGFPDRSALEALESKVETPKRGVIELSMGGR